MTFPALQKYNSNVRLYFVAESIDRVLAHLDRLAVKGE